MIKSLGFDYSAQDVQQAYAKFQTKAHSIGRTVDIHYFRDFWSTCNFLDPLNREVLSHEEVEENAFELQTSYDTDYYEGLYTSISRTLAVEERESLVHKVMQQRSCEARSVWFEFQSDPSSVWLDKVHVRMLLVDLGSSDCSSAAVERLVSNEMERNKEGLVHFEDFVSWWMIHNAAKVQAHIQLHEKRALLLHRQSTRRMGKSPALSPSKSTTTSPLMCIGEFSDSPFDSPSLLESPRVTPYLPDTPRIPSIHSGMLMLVGRF
jgi:hypothetical protein